jgi:hypothetical protein
MKLNEKNFALASGFAVTIVDFIKYFLMPLIHRKGTTYMMSKMYGLGWGLFIKLTLVFIFTTATGWLLAFFYNKLCGK